MNFTSWFILLVLLTSPTLLFYATSTFPSLVRILIVRLSHLNLSLNFGALGFLPCTEFASNLISNHHDIIYPIRSHVVVWWFAAHQLASPSSLPFNAHLLFFVICSIIFGFVFCQSCAWCGFLHPLQSARSVCPGSLLFPWSQTAIFFHHPSSFVVTIKC